MPKLWNKLKPEQQQALKDLMGPDWQPNDKEPVEIAPKEVEREMKKKPRYK